MIGSKKRVGNCKRMVSILTYNRNWFNEINANWSVIHEDTKFAAAQKEALKEGSNLTAKEVRELLFRLLFTKVDKDTELTAIHGLKLECRASSAYTTEFAGKIYKGKVSGMTRFTGELIYTTHNTKVFTKFITHPFYQCGSMDNDGD